MNTMNIIKKLDFNIMRQLTKGFRKFNTNNNDVLKFDVAIIGGGISGLSTAIKLKQLAKKNNREISVSVFDKGSQIGAHILSGCIMDPIGLNTLLPDWKELSPPEYENVKNERLVYLPNLKQSISFPNKLLPKIFHNDSNIIVNLTSYCQWLSNIAIDYGVEIFEKTSVTEILYDQNNRVCGIKLGDCGKNKNNKPKPNYQEGIPILANYTIMAEGVRGNNTIELCKKYNNLYQGPIPYALGIKEIWDCSNNKDILPSGTVKTLFGYPNMSVGGFMYQMDKYLHLGFIYPLNYKNAGISIYEEMQKFKSHKLINKYINNSKMINYGAKSITEGGIQCINDIHFPGGCLVGECGGMIDNVRLKGTHLGILTGIDAAKSMWENLKKSSQLIGEGGHYTSHPDLLNYTKTVKSSDYYSKLTKYKNLKYYLSHQEYFNYYKSLLFPNFDKKTVNYKHWDRELTQYIKPIEYPKHDNKITRSREESLDYSGLYYEDDQPCHLKLQNNNWKQSYSSFKGLEEKLCPAHVYEYSAIDHELHLVIHYENCLHCKACSIKFPNEFIKWTPPEGGSGPQYTEV